MTTIRETVGDRQRRSGKNEGLELPSYELVWPAPSIRQMYAEAMQSIQRQYDKAIAELKNSR